MSASLKSDLRIAWAFCLKMSVTFREYADFRVSSEGEVQGVGLLIASDTSTGRLVVLSPLEGSPAARAGVKSGDEASC